MDEDKAKQWLAEALKDTFGAKFDEIKSAFDEGKEKIKELEATNAEFKAFKEKVERTPAEKVKLPVPGSDKMVTAYRGYDLKFQGKALEIKDKLIVSPEDREVISKFLINSISKATNIEGDAARGGYLVPEEYANVVMAHARENSVMLRDATVIPMGSDTLNMPRELANVAVTWGDEESALGASNPTFGNIQLVARRMGAYTIASNELLADEKFDFVSMLTSQFGEAIALAVDNACFNGNVSSTFTGCLSGATTNTVTCAATGTSPSRHIQLTHAELSQAISKLVSPRLQGAKFYIHRNSLHYLRVEEDGAGNPIWSPPAGTVPGRIYEFPYEVVTALPAAPGAATAFAIFGNMKKGYVIGVRNSGMSLEVNPFTGWVNYQTYFRVVNRYHGQMGLESALVAIKTHA